MICLLGTECIFPIQIDPVVVSQNRVDLICLDVHATMAIKALIAQNAFVLSVEHGVTKQSRSMWPIKQRNVQIVGTAKGQRDIVSAWRVSLVQLASGWHAQMIAAGGGFVKQCGCLH